MKIRTSDGSAGDADYGQIGSGYEQFRQPEQKIAALLNDAFGSARTVLNVGAGAGSYEPGDRQVTAVEPSASMRLRRPGTVRPAIDAVAEALPFGDRSFDASMATFTIHQWQNLSAGLAEMRRVTRGPVVILTCDPDLVEAFWLVRYAPEVLAVEARRYPAIATVLASLGASCTVTDVPIPLDCVDGFGEAYYGRPERLLEPGVRRACSAWSFVEESVVERFARDLNDDLNSGRWDALYGHLRRQPEFSGSLRLIVGNP